MLKNDPQAPKVDKMAYTSSTIMFYWACDKIYDKIRHHNIFLNGDYKKSYDQIFEDHTLPEEPSFYVNAPKRSDPTVAPEGRDSLMVLVPVGHLTNNVNPKKWEETRQKVRTKNHAQLGPGYHNSQIVLIGSCVCYWAIE